MTSPNGLLLCWAALLPATLVSCAHPTYRQITAEHWHDKDTVVIAYTDFARKGNLLYSPVESTAHIVVCRVARDNSVTCREQPLADRVLAGQPTARVAPPSPPATGSTTAPAAAPPPRPPEASSPAVTPSQPPATEPPPETSSAPVAPQAPAVLSSEPPPDVAPNQ